MSNQTTEEVKNYLSAIKKMTIEEIRDNGLMIKEYIVKRLYFHNNYHQNKTVRLFRWIKFLSMSKRSRQIYVIKNIYKYKSVYLKLCKTGSLGKYNINMFGQLQVDKSNHNTVPVKLKQNNGGYRYFIYDSNKKYYIHRFLCKVYLEIPKTYSKEEANNSQNYEVNHIRKNNKRNNTILNLQWTTKLQNQRHANIDEDYVLAPSLNSQK